MRIYISGPVTGREEMNLPAFAAAAKVLLNRGHEPLIPHTILPWSHTGSCPKSYAAGQDGNHTAACYLRGDLAEMLKCDGLYMLSDWEASVGARLEHSVAAHCGMDIQYQDAEFAG
jgi:hypothetical protein